MPYDGMDPELSGKRYKAWEKLRAYNDSVLRESEKQRQCRIVCLEKPVKTFA